MGDVLEQLLSSWVPISAAILSTAMAFAPMGDVLWCRRNKSLGKINADVFPILFGNGIGWVVYGIFSDNFYMVAGCASYFVAGIFYIHTGYSLSTSDAARRRIEVATLSIMGVWLVLWVTAIQTSHKVLRNNVIGTAATVTQLLLFASPLSTMAKVIRVKSAASINTFFASIGALCSMLWIVDGFVLDDFYLYAPNILTLALGVSQLMLSAVYGSKPEPEGSDSGLLETSRLWVHRRPSDSLA